MTQSEVPALGSVMRGMILPVYLPSFLTAVAQNAIQIVLPLYALDLGGDAAAAATVVGLRGVGTMVMDVPAGVAVSRLGDKWVMAGGLGLLFVMSLVAATADGIWLLSLVALMFGMGLGVWLLARLNYVTDSAPIAVRGRVISVMAGLQRAGALVGPVTGGIVVETYGYSTLFIGTAVLFASSLAVILVFGRAARPDLDGHPMHARLTAVVRENVRTFATAGSAMVALQILRAARLLLIPLWGAMLGLDTSTIGLVFSLSSAFDMVMFYPAGLILDHVGRKVAGVTSILLLATALALLPATTGFWSFLGVAALSGIGNGFGTGIFMTFGGDLSPRTRRGEFLGVWRLVGDVGTASGPFMIAGLAGLLSLPAACLVVAALGVAGAGVLGVLVPEPLRREGG